MSAPPSLLHAAVDEGNVNKVETLLESGSDHSALDDGQNTPLHIASYRGHTNIAILLLKSRANANNGNENGDTPLHLAALADRFETIKALIEIPKETGGEATNLEAQDAQGYCALHYACGEGFLNIAEYLVKQQRANVHTHNADGLTPLMCAVQQGHCEIVHFLVQCDPSVVRDVNCSGDTALHYAAISDDGIESAKTLLRAGADPEAYNSDKHTPLLEALVEKRMDMIRFLKHVVPQIREAKQKLTGDALKEAVDAIVSGKSIAISSIPSSVFTDASSSKDGNETAVGGAIVQRKAIRPTFCISRAGLRTKTTIQKLQEERAAAAALGKEIDVQPKTKPISSKKIFQPTPSFGIL